LFDVFQGLPRLRLDAAWHDLAVGAHRDLARYEHERPGLDRRRERQRLPAGAGVGSPQEFDTHVILRWLDVGQQCCAADRLAAPQKGGAANIAMIGEPQTLDPMASTADLVGIITQHVYELLYTFDANWNVTPMLAESMPVISKDGLVYTIPLRKDVKFHNGKEMTSDDVVASLKRWMDTAPRGKAVAKEIKSLEAKGPNSIVITLNRPYTPLLAHL